MVLKIPWDNANERETDKVFTQIEALGNLEIGLLSITKIQ